MSWVCTCTSRASQPKPIYPSKRVGVVNPRRMRSEGYSSLSVGLSVCLSVYALQYIFAPLRLPNHPAPSTCGLNPLCTYLTAWAATPFMSVLIPAAVNIPACNPPHCSTLPIATAAVATAAPPNPPKKASTPSPQLASLIPLPT